MKKLTKRQQEILTWIQEFILTKGYSPSLQEIADAHAFNSNAAHCHVSALIEKGRLEKTEGRMRTLRIP